MKNKPLHIYCKTFQQNYYIFYGVSKKELQKSLYKIFDIKENTEEYLDGRCFILEKKNNSIICIWTEKKRLPTLVHELVHAAIFMCQLRNIKIDAEDEIVPYTVNMLLKEVIEK